MPIAKVTKTVRIDMDTAEWIAQHSYETGKSHQQIMEDALDDYKKRAERKKP